MVSEERAQRYSEHHGYKKREHYVIAARTRCRSEVALPELNKVRKTRGHDEYAVDESISQEEHEELVVEETDAVVDPRTVVVHLEDAAGAYAAVVRAVGLDQYASVTVAD